MKTSQLSKELEAKAGIQAKPLSETFDATLKKIYFESPRGDGFIIGLFRRIDTKQSITCKGILNPATVDLQYTLKGTWIQDKKYGMQVNIEEGIPHISADDPNTLQDCLKKHIPKPLAKELIHKHGKDLAPLLREGLVPNQDNMAGLLPDKQKEIYEEWLDFIANAEIYVKLTEWGISQTYHKRILRMWGRKSAQKIEEDPYILTQISGIGFKKADALALSMGVPPHDERRVLAATLDTLQQEQANGHTWSNYDYVVRAIRRTIGVSLEDYSLDNRIQVDETRCYTKGLFQAEQTIEDAVSSFLARNKSYFVRKRVLKIPQGEELQIALEGANEEQSLAISSSLQNNLSIISGGPGTGKTWCVQKLLQLLPSTQVVLLAPTGKAAARLSAICSREAYTIHAYLCPADEELTTFQFCAANPAPHSIYVIDEFSMVDSYLAASLFSAIPPDAHVIIIGDIDQLPSIRAGAVLRDLLYKLDVPSHFLTQVVRSKEDSCIVKNANHIRNGWIYLETGVDFDWFHAGDEESICARILAITRTAMATGDGTIPQFLCPMHRTPIGTRELNNLLQETVNPNGEQVRGTRFRIGDKVVCGENLYKQRIMNGDIAYIHSSDETSIFLHLETEDKPREFSKEITDSLSLAYVLSIHKAQGSEYGHVVLILHSSHYIMLKRNLLYTGVTRARDKVTLIGSKKVVAMAIGNLGEERRTKFWQMQKGEGKAYTLGKEVELLPRKYLSEEEVE